jgi:hypothetical protein
MHIISSTAVFLLSSPFALTITSIKATASHNSTEIGTIDYPYPFDVKAGENESPRLPVQWALDGGTARDALGGTLKLDAVADVGVKIGAWQEQVRYEGHGIGAKVRL